MEIFKFFKVYLVFIILCLAGSGHTYSQEKVFDLWETGVPGSIESKDYKEQYRRDSERNITGISRVSTPTLTLFKPEEKKRNGTAVVILPGGGYGHLSIEKEGYKVARWFNEAGVTAFVLKYRLPSDKIMKDKSVAPLTDAQQALRYVRENATKWRLDPDKIGVLGFSAGGHLAASLSTRFEEETVPGTGEISARPDFSVLIYPVISMADSLTHEGSRTNLLGKQISSPMKQRFSNEHQVKESTPPTFLVHATDDHAVPVENSLVYYSALKEKEVPVELHVYEKGGHGFGMGTTGTQRHWPEALKKWLQEHNFIEKEPALLFSYFKGNGEDGLHFAHSEDGYVWRALNDDESFLKPELGNEKLMRDPNIIKGGDGKYHMVWTVGWTEKGIGYASSEDLVNWSEQKFIPVMEHEENARNTWAPEITYDPDSEEYMIYWATTIRGRFPETQIEADDGYNHRMYYTITKDFKNFSPTKLLYEPGFNVIDASLVRHEGEYIMFLKDETREPAQKNIKIARSKSLTGPYTEASEPITGEYWAEGPTAAFIDGTWIVYFDKYIEKGFGAVKSEDLENWEDISDQIIFPEGARHGSVIKVPEEILSNLKTQ